MPYLFYHHCVFVFLLVPSDQDQSRQIERPLSIRARAHESLSFLLHFSSILGRHCCVVEIHLLHYDPWRVDCSNWSFGSGLRVVLGF